MSEQEVAELELELSQQIGADERMLLNYEARFWKHRAWRAEQQRERADLAKKEAEAIIEKYKRIPQEKLDELLKQINNEALALAKKEAEMHVGTIGLTNFRRLTWDSEKIKCVDQRIAFWKNVAKNHQQYAPEDEEVSDTEEGYDSK